jgi:2-polyprenyl-3-methyl-5-hydroxy-6-metoxy-1,4-benzoquinol methylase
MCWGKNAINKKRANSLCCPACKGTKISDKWKYHNDPNGFYVYWCERCGFGWRHPLSDPNELRQKYKAQSAYDIIYKNESTLGFQKRIQRLCKIYPQKGHLLDIGSGPGHFLSIAAGHGWQVAGIEPRQEAAQFCLEHFGIKAHKGFLEDFNESPGTYDVITIWDVFEHVPDHAQFFDQCLALLKPGGVLAFSVPNASGFPARFFKGRWRYVMPVHLNYFTIQYMYNFLSSRNVQIAHVDHTIKVHSLIQGLATFSPVKVDVKKLFRAGGKVQRLEEGKPKNSTEKIQLVEPGFLNALRKLAFKINMISLPIEKGDMIDCYCRKKHE